jgi:hypothetical protein
MSQPEIRAKIYTIERSKKLSASLKGRESTCYWTGKKLSKLHRQAISKGKKVLGDPFKGNRGGNGRGATLPQRLLASVLPSDFIIEYPISLGKRQKGYPTNYKVDIGSPLRKIAIEVDGEGHRFSKVQMKDRKKEKRLSELGWKVLRVKNSTVLSMFLISK